MKKWSESEARRTASRISAPARRRACLPRRRRPWRLAAVRARRVEDTRREPGRARVPDRARAERAQHALHVRLPEGVGQPGAARERRRTFGRLPPARYLAD